MTDSPNTSFRYVHPGLERRRRALRWMLAHLGWPVFARIGHIEGVERIPVRGPAILFINHIAWVDPIAVLGHVPRNVVPIAKAESSRVPFWGIFARLWRVIPVRRDGGDQGPLHDALGVLASGELVLLAPEATRSPALRQARDGLAYLAWRSGAPVIPVALEGTGPFPEFLAGLRSGPAIEVRVGTPLRLRPLHGRPSRDTLRAITNEAMGHLAAMLPEHRRGVYQDAAHAAARYFDREEAEASAPPHSQGSGRI